ncbi:MAG: hypothetical protein Q4E05_02860 [Pseudoclavibacter sp.]|nr:hypothetical protein [Pseudoclavibacter sp.]
MRFILAAIAMAASLTMFLVGFLQISEARAHDHVTVAGQSVSGAPVVVIPSETLTSRSGSQTVEISAAGPVTAVVGRQGDVAGWIGSASHERAELGEEGALVFTAVAGEEATVPSPAGSDLWFQEYAEDGRMKIEPSLPPGFAIMIVGDGAAAALETVSITWPLDGRAPWSGPLLIGGAFFLLLALALLLWQLLRMRRDRKPRRRAAPVAPAGDAEASRPVTGTTPSPAPLAAEESASAFTLDPVTGLVRTPAPPGAEEAGTDWEEPVAAPGDAGSGVAPEPPPTEAMAIGVGTGGPAGAGDAAFDADGPFPPSAPERAELPGAGEPSEPSGGRGRQLAHEQPIVQGSGFEAPALDDGAPEAPASEEPEGFPPTAAFAPERLEDAPAAGPPGAPPLPPPVDGAATSSFQVPSGSSFAVAGEPISEPEEPTPFVPPRGSAFSDPAADVSAPEGSGSARALPEAEGHGPLGERDPLGGGLDEPDGRGAAPGEERHDQDEHDEHRGRDDEGPRHGGGLGDGGRGRGAGQAAAQESSKWKRPRGRDRSNAPKRAFRIARTLRLVPLLLAGGLALSGCSANFWPEAVGGAAENPTATPTSSIDEALIAEGAPYPALSVEQLSRIIGDARAVAEKADAAKDAESLKARFTQSAWAERDAYYRLQKADAAQSGPPGFPSGQIVYTVPQATFEWPRTVFTVVEPGKPDAPSYGVMLLQKNARDAYKVASLVPLQNVQMPQAAPVEIGSQGLSEVASQLVLPPEEIVPSYGDLVENGEASAANTLFSPENDSLREQIGPAYREGKLGEIDQAASKITFQIRAAQNAPPLGVATLDGGAIVAVTMEEVETLAATSSIATLSASGKTALLAGTGSSPYGFERIYSDQLLFYVPSAEAGGQIRFLGSSQQMVSGRQLDASEVSLA